MEQWFLYTKKSDFARISRQFHISPILARILRNRDIISDEDISRFLFPDSSRAYDPMLLKGMKEGIETAHTVVKSEGKIRIIGDYDADGICSSLILASFFESLGADADVRLPDRVIDGYGMNEQMVYEALRDHVSLIITCDNGISCVESVQYAKEQGLKVIITDHHEPGPVIPDADSVIDAKQSGCEYPFKEICGAAVAYKFVQAYNCEYHSGQEKLLDDLLQYVGFATIADIVPLIDENRIFASQGLKRLTATENPGLSALIQERGIIREHINASTVGFILAPCINSAGRISNAGLSYELLRTKDPQRAAFLAQELSCLNEQRKTLTAQQTQIAVEDLKKLEQTDRLDRILTVFLPDAHESLSGIIAGRIKEEYNRPAFVITRSSEGLKGSGRSIESYNMISGLQRDEDLFVKYGGHPMACGFTLKSLGSEQDTVRNFASRINHSSALTDNDLIKKIWIDMELPFKYVTRELVEELKKLEPFGTGNEKPAFAGREIKVRHASVLGTRHNVLKLHLEDGYKDTMEGIMFGSEEQIAAKYQEVIRAKRINVLFYPDMNEFRGKSTPQILIRTFMPVNG